MHPGLAKFFADHADRYRREGNVPMAEVMERSLTLNLERERDRELEAEFERDLREHHRRIKRGIE